MGNLYVPYGTGRLLRVTKATNSILIGLGAEPVYFDYDTTATKLHSTTAGNANSDFGADISYSDIALYTSPLDFVRTGATLVELTYYFVAIGY